MTSLFLQAPRIWPRRSRKDEAAPLSFQVPCIFRGKPRSKSVDAHRFIRRRGMTPPPPILHPIFSTDGSDVEIIMNGPAPEPLGSHPPSYHSFPSRRGYDLVEVAPRRGRIPRREVFHSREPSRGRSSARILVERKTSSRDHGTLVSYSPTRRITFEEVRRPHSRSRSSRRTNSPIISRSTSRSKATVIHMEPLEGVGQPSRRSRISRTPSPAGSRYSELSLGPAESPISSCSSTSPTPRRRSSSRGPPPALTRSPIQKHREPLASVVEAPSPAWDGSPASPVGSQHSYVRTRENDREARRSMHHRANSAPALPHMPRADPVPEASPNRYRYTPVEDDHTHIREFVREMEQGGRRQRPMSVPPPPPSSSVGRSRRSRRQGGHERTQSASYIASETNVWPSSGVSCGPDHHQYTSTPAISYETCSRSLPRVVSFERLRDSASVAPSDSVSATGRSLARDETVEPSASASVKASSTTSKRSPSTSSTTSQQSSSIARKSSSTKSDASTTPSKASTSTPSSSSSSSSDASSSSAFARRRGALGAAPKFSERFSVCLNSDAESNINDVSSVATTATSPEQDARRMRGVRKMLRFADWVPSDK